MSESSKRIVEIDGVKVEVDLRQAKVVDAYRVGMNVKVLKKRYDGYESLPGVIVGFDDFTNLPTIVVAILECSWGADPKIEFVYFNAKSKELELAPAIADEFPVTREEALKHFDRAIGKHEAEIRALQEKREYFLRRFGLAAEKQEPVDA